MRNKKIILFIIIVIIVILLFPIPFKLKDGGSIEFKAILYSVTKYHQINPEVDGGYVDGIGIEILGAKVLDTRNRKTEIITITESENINEQNERSFFGKVIKSETSYIIVEPNNNEDIRKSADKISISLGEYNDALYEVGTNVKITYDGTIIESYPAQVKAKKIEVKSTENFEIIFKDSYNKVYTILDKTETNKYDYNIYAYDGSVNIKIDDKEYSLKDALLENKITMDEIIAKANQDEKNGKIKAEMYADGGSMEYHYENYTIIKCHTLDGNRDVYIGSKDLNINDVI